MKVEKLTLKQIVIMGATTFSFLVLFGALCTPLMAYYKIDTAHSLYIAYTKLCTQIPSKAFYINGYAIPLCARCLGIYTGVFLTLMLYLERIKINHNLYLALGILGFGEFFLEKFRIIFPNNFITLTAGVFIGCFLIVTVLKANIKFKKDY